MSFTSLSPKVKFCTGGIFWLSLILILCKTCSILVKITVFLSSFVTISSSSFSDSSVFNKDNMWLSRSFLNQIINVRNRIL